MNTTKKNIALDFSSTLLHENAIALRVSSNKKEGNSKSDYSLLLAKVFTFCFWGMLLFSACKKDIDLLPSPTTANLNDTLLKAGVPTYYVATNGNDANGNGTIAKPWASLYKATQMVTKSGDIIHIAAGTYTEPKMCSLSVGVSLVGEGAATTIIKGTYVIPDKMNFSTATLRLNSSSTGTNGNQSISYITFDGNGLRGSRAISVYNRGNVKIHHCTIKDFFYGGVLFYSANMYSTNPGALLEVKNEIYNCTIDNCGDTDATYDGDGLIFISAQKDMLIHDNILYSNKRIGSHNGNIINAGGRRFLGVKYYNNHSWKPDPTYGGWNFHLEIWGNDGGFEIYNNTFTGGSVAIDCAGPYSAKGPYDYSWSIHDNKFEFNDPNLVVYEGLPILLESKYLVKTLIYNNTFTSSYNGISLISWNAKDVFIYDNTFNRIRQPFIANYARQGKDALVGALSASNINFFRNKIFAAPTAQTIDGCIRLNPANGWDMTDVNIYNNTIVTNKSLITKAVALIVGANTVVTNLNIKNNIFCYFKNGGPMYVSNSGTVNGLHIQNNLSYNLANYNTVPVFVGKGISNYTYLNNIPTSNTKQKNPLFVNEATQDFHLQAGSPAINSGVNVGLPYNGTAPDISAYEF